MPKKTYTFPRLRDRSLAVSPPLVTASQFKQIRSRQPEVPSRPAEIRQLSRWLFPPLPQRRRPPKKVRLNNKFTLNLGEECLEYAHGLLFSALKNPSLSQRDRDAVDADMDGSLPVFERSHETAHFILRWTNTSAVPEDNIAPDQENIITQTAGFLEHARQVYLDTFGLEPYILPGQAKIEILFYYLGETTNGSTNDTWAYIQLNSKLFKDNPNLWKPVSAHELFHRVQYQAGYRTHPGYETTGYFVEGTTSWAEMFVWQAVSNPDKVKAFYQETDIDVLTLSGDARYRAGVFWHFVEKRINQVPAFMAGYAATGKVTDTLRQVVAEAFPANGVYGNLEHFITLWHRNRLTGENKPANILGPDGTVINANLANITTHALSAAEPTLAVQGSSQPHGADFIRITLSGLQGKELALHFQGQGDFCIQFHFFNLQFKWVRGFYPFFAHDQFGHTQTVGADEIYLWAIIGGRENGGDYTLEVTGLY